ncbi:MAG: polysaccharide biosynthesis tyrosine autokinase [Phycisphaeraceae bacterium]|nr:polysaccharide biosynthesis tyrosine autokinase [Phycisphaeraceae bacterium]
MTTSPTGPNTPPGPSANRPSGGGAPAGGGGMGGVAIDPVKLLMKYKYILAGAAGVGMVLGVVLYFLLLKFRPIWTSSAVFETFTPTSSIVSPTGIGTMESQTEIERFMLTQARQMTREDVLNRVANDPRLSREAPQWTAQFEEGGRIDIPAAVKELQLYVAKTRIIPGTKLIELSASCRWKEDSTALAKLLREAYMTELKRVAGSSTQNQRDQIQSQLEKFDRELREYQTRRDTLLRDAGMTTINEQGSETLQRLYILNTQILDVQNQIQLRRVSIKQLQDQLDNPAGVQYTDQIRSEVDESPLIVSIKQSIQSAEAEQKGMLMRGLTREHREYKRTDSLLQGMNQNLEQRREELMRQRFNSNLEQMKIVLQSLENQEREMTKDRDTISEKQQVAARTLAQVKDLEEKIMNIQRSIANLTDQQRTLAMLAELPTNNRVVVASEERVPREVSSPRLTVVLPASMLGVVGLVTALILAIELMDSRVKGPADIALMPRTRLLGWIPDASEDPSGAGAIETTFRDRPRGVIAENYRQLRSVIAKRLGQAGHKSLVVIGGMPGSGSTSVMCNMGLAWAAADKKVLLIDANFRRPGTHRVFALRESPGLADVLTGASIEEAVQHTSDARLDVLSAGSREKRVFEMFSSERFSQLLAELKARYDLVLIDVAPALVASDGLSIANRTDASCLVVRALGEKRGLVGRLRNDLSEAKGEFLGVVVNAVKPSAGGYIRGNMRATHEYQNPAEAPAAA